tara:strand:+ start:98 stop:388 length:291 start_codon:yes stop_codon:yes gene_type:complete
MKKLIAILAIAIIYLTITITYHPITQWVCDGRKNKVSYYHYDASMIHINIHKEGKVVGEDIFTRDHINIWMFFGWPNGMWNLQWLELTESIKIKTT